MNCPICGRPVTEVNVKTIFDNTGFPDINLLQIIFYPCGDKLRRSDDPATYNRITEELRVIVDGRLK